MKYLVMVFCVLTLWALVSAAAVQNKGAEEITLEGGDRGTVKFTHHKHQNKLGDCNICHSLFPQEPGAIVKLKSGGQLVGKQIMNKLCIKCHKAQKKAGNKAGPVTCSKCHHKKG